MLTIIIVSYNSQKVMTKCLGSLIDSKVYPVIVVDNASTDGSAEALRNRFPDAMVKALPQNMGYGRAANVGLRMVETPYALLLNPDLKASVEDIGKLLDHARSDTANTAIWGPASQKKDLTGEAPQSVEWISGCAMLFDMEKLRTLGFFDENIFLFFEETDLCVRARDAGFQVRLCRDIFFDHMLGQASTPNPAIERMKNWHYGWSRCYYFDKRGQAKGKRSPLPPVRPIPAQVVDDDQPEEAHQIQDAGRGGQDLPEGGKSLRSRWNPSTIHAFQPINGGS